MRPFIDYWVYSRFDILFKLRSDSPRIQKRNL